MTVASAELLDRIAAALGVPAVSFHTPIPQETADTTPAGHVAALWFDPHGRRFAAAFVDLPPHIRKALADTAEIARACHSVDPTQGPASERRS